MSKHHVKAGDARVEPFEIPGATEGTFHVAQLSSGDESSPPVYILRLGPGSRIPRHMHHRTSEQHYVIEGVFFDEGVAYGSGSFLSYSAGEPHGPHATETGASILSVRPGETVGPEGEGYDYHIVEG